MGRFDPLAIRAHRPWRTALWFALLLALVLVAAAALYWRELGDTLGALAESSLVRRDLARHVDELSAENTRLAAEVAILRREIQVKGEAYRMVEADLAAQGLRIAELRDEVQFYRGLFKRSLETATLGVHGLRFQAAGGEGAYGYRVVLTHMGKGDNVIEGAMDLRLTGRLEGQRHTIEAKDLGAGARQEFKLKHFRQLDGRILLPPGFEPQQVEVSVRAGDEDSIHVDHSYQWSAVVDSQQRGQR